MAEVRITEGFEADLHIVHSDRVFEDILRVLSALEAIPSMGSADVPESIRRMFGAGARKIPVNAFDVITVYHADQDAVDVLGLVHQRAAW